MSTSDPERGAKGDKGEQGIPGQKGDKGEQGQRGIGVEDEIHLLGEALVENTVHIQGLSLRLRLTKWAMIVIGVVVIGLCLVGAQEVRTQKDLSRIQDELRVIQCNQAITFLEAIDEASDPEDPLTKAEERQALKFREIYTEVYKSLDCAEIHVDGAP